MAAAAARAACASRDGRAPRDAQLRHHMRVAAEALCQRHARATPVGRARAAGEALPARLHRARLASPASARATTAGRARTARCARAMACVTARATVLRRRHLLVRSHFSGADCSQRTCADGCAAPRSRCNGRTGACVCSVGWSGAACMEPCATAAAAGERHGALPQRDLLLRRRLQRTALRGATRWLRRRRLRRMASASAATASAPTGGRATCGGPCVRTTATATASALAAPTARPALRRRRARRPRALTVAVGPPGTCVNGVLLRAGLVRL